jgi:nickel/cobalt exporter
VRPALRFGAAMALALATLLAAPPASAHPLGNFTVNLYSGLAVEPGRLRVHYVVDMAEIPAFQEMARIDRDGNGDADAAERDAYASAKAAELMRGITATASGRPIPLTMLSTSMSFPPGQAGLPTLRLEAVFAGPVATAAEIAFRDRNYADRIGWREITAVGVGGEVLRRSSVPARSVSDSLRTYPQTLLSDPLRMSSAVVTAEPGVSAPAAAGEEGGAARPGGSGFAALATWSGLSLPVFLAALLLAAGFGAGHALLPGHGKTIMAAYLVGSNGRIRHAVTIGAAVAFMHTASVLGVGLAILAVERLVSPERIYPWLTLASGVLVLVLGGGLLAARIRARSAARAHGHEHPDAPHSLSRPGLAALALSGGILPSPTAVLVLLSTVAAGRVAFGLSLILAFSAGLAAALSAIGILVLRARRLLLPRLPDGVGRLAPVVGAVVIIGAGLYLTGTGLGRL